MNENRFAELAAQAREGNHAALRQLLIQAYTPVFYQCRKLLQDQQAAEDMTRKVLRAVRTRLDTLKDPEHFERWVSGLTAKRCMEALRQKTPEKDQLRKKLKIPGAHLDERETAAVVDQLVDALPDEIRICIVLHCCGRIPVKGIAQLTGFDGETVTDNLKMAQELVNGSLQKLHRKGVEFASVTSLPELLQMVMYTPCKDPQDVADTVNAMLGKQPVKAAPAAPRRSGTRRLWIAVILLAILLLGMLCTALALEMKQQKEQLPEETTAATETLPQETEETATTAETTVETTVETTAETTVPTTAVETTAETTEAVTEPETEAALPVPEPQTQESQPDSSKESTPSGTESTPAANSGTHVHSYQDAGPIGAQSASCESPGWRTKICFVCGDTVRYQDTANAPALGHNYSSTVKAPTTSQEGYTVHTCSRCGKSYTDNYVPKLPEETQAPVAAPQEELPEGT